MDDKENIKASDSATVVGSGNGDRAQGTARHRARPLFAPTNPLLHSLFQDRLCEMSTMVAQTLMSLAADVPVDSVNMMGTANCTYVRRLLECITVNQRCDLARELVGCVWPVGKIVP